MYLECRYLILALESMQSPVGALGGPMSFIDLLWVRPGRRHSRSQVSACNASIDAHPMLAIVIERTLFLRAYFSLSSLHSDVLPLALLHLPAASCSFMQL